MDALTKKKFIEEKTKVVEQYMAEIEFQLKSGLDLIDEYKKEAKLESDEFQEKIVSIIKKIEFCAATVETELDVEGAPTYYIANGRINIANEEGFTITNADDDDADDDDDDDDDDDSSDDDSDASFTEEERKHIQDPDHYKYLKRYSLKPTAQFSFTITQNIDDISLSEVLDKTI
jgi:hypothetical protein